MYEKYIKRFFDVVLCSAALVVLSPIFLITALAIKISSPGSVFYYSDRAGKNKKAFHFYKFRSMHNVDAKHKQKDLYTADQDRLFTVGKVIRKLKIDELPQLINVIKGDMSIIGPRPMPISSVDRQYCGEYSGILDVKPGLSSAASLYDYIVGERFADDEEMYRKNIVPVKLELELLYLKKQSFWYDFCMVLRTINTIALVSIGTKEFRELPELSELNLKSEEVEKNG